MTVLPRLPRPWAWATRMERSQDIATGLALAVLGAAAAVISSGYPGASGLYPAALGCALAVMGGAGALRAVFASGNVSRPLVDNPVPLALTLASMVAYLALVPAIGFFTASTLLVLALPATLGLRRPILLAGTATIFIAIVYALFTFVLKRPLPPELWQTG